MLTVIPFHYTVASISTTGSVSETLIKQSDHFIRLTELTKNRFGHCSCVWFFQNTIRPTNGWIRQWKYHSFLSHFFCINIQRPGEKAVSPPIANMTGPLKVVSIIYEIKGGFCKSSSHLVLQGFFSGWLTFHWPHLTKIPMESQRPVPEL